MDNVTNIEPADNEERLLKGILEGDTETNIEPAGTKERLLKAILENGGGGSGGSGVMNCGDYLAAACQQLARSVLTPLADASPNTWMDYYLPISPDGSTAEFHAMVSAFQTEVGTARSAGKIPMFGATECVVDGSNGHPSVTFTSEDDNNNKWYEFKYVFTDIRIYFRFICHEPTLFPMS